MALWPRAGHFYGAARHFYGVRSNSSFSAASAPKRTGSPRTTAAIHFYRLLKATAAGFLSGARRKTRS